MENTHTEECTDTTSRNTEEELRLLIRLKELEMEEERREEEMQVREKMRKNITAYTSAGLLLLVLSFASHLLQDVMREPVFTVLEGISFLAGSILLIIALLYGIAFIRHKKHKML